MALYGNRWRAVADERYTITSNTVLEFEYESDGRGEVQGIGFDEDDVASGWRIFNLAGSQDWGISDYSYSGGVQQFSIPVGQHYSGSNMRLFIANDHDTVPRDSYGTFRNVRVCEGPCPAVDNGASDTSLYFVHTDHLGTPQLLSDWQQNVVWTLDYTPFGEVISDSAEQEASRFPGQYFDVATGVSYNYFRGYDPSLGRYLQSDPIGLEGGINTYAYVTGNPLSYSDAYGLYANFAIGLGVRVVGGRAAGAAVQSGLQGVVGRTAGRALSCALIGYCSEAGGAKEVGDRTEEEERQAQEEYDSIKYYCDDFPKRWDYPDECSFISRKIDHLNYCIDRFENFDLKWASGRHSSKIKGWRNALENLKNEHLAKCTNIPEVIECDE